MTTAMKLKSAGLISATLRAARFLQSEPSIALPRRSVAALTTTCRVSSHSGRAIAWPCPLAGPLGRPVNKRPVTPPVTCLWHGMRTARRCSTPPSGWARPLSWATLITRPNRFIPKQNEHPDHLAASFTQASTASKPPQFEGKF